MSAKVRQRAQDRESQREKKKEIGRNRVKERDCMWVTVRTCTFVRDKDGGRDMWVYMCITEQTTNVHYM